MRSSNEPSLRSLAINQPTYVGQLVTVIAALTGPAPEDGANVTLAADPVVNAICPKSVVVPAGATTASFTITPRVAGSISIYGNYGPGTGVTKYVAFTAITGGSTPVPAPIPVSAPVPTPVPTPVPAPVSSTPTFSDTFSSGALDTSKWIVSNWTVADYAGAGSDVTFSPANVKLGQGMLQLTLNQPSAGASTGAELQSKSTFGYGTYEVRCRMASTSPTPSGVGNTASGCDSAMFCFIDNSETELDIEFCGNTPGLLNITNWFTTAAHQTAQPAASGLDTGFHDYKLVWSPSQVQWYLDGVLIGTHTEDVPSAPAYIMLNFWGTNSANWGGLASPGVTRYMYVESVSFTPQA